MKQAKRKLTLMADGRKVYRGKIYYFRGDYASCLKEWEAAKVIADNATGYGRVIEQLRAYSRLQEAVPALPFGYFRISTECHSPGTLGPALHAANLAVEEEASKKS